MEKQKKSVELEQQTTHPSEKQPSVKKLVRTERWYFGGLSGVLAACCTHPLDTLKVQLQTQQRAEYGLVGMAFHVIRTEGFLSLYNGLSASCLRQATYTTTRFAIYGAVKTLNPNPNLPFYQKVSLAFTAGAIGSLVGAPADLINVRMQNDCKLPEGQRRNYKHAIDGIFRVWREEGPKKLFNGASMAIVRGAFVTVGQIAFYEQVKQLMLASGYFKDNPVTHFGASFTAGVAATLLTMPLDVMKTRLMNARPGQYASLMDCFTDIFKLGIGGFFKGFTPAFIRLGPHTILMFIFLEQLKQNFGYMKEERK